MPPVTAGGSTFGRAKALRRNEAKEAASTFDETTRGRGFIAVIARDWRRGWRVDELRTHRWESEAFAGRGGDSLTGLTVKIGNWLPPGRRPHTTSVLYSRPMPNADAEPPR